MSIRPTLGNLIAGELLELIAGLENRHMTDGD